MTRWGAAFILILLFSGCKRVPSSAEVARDDSAELATGFGLGELPAASQMLHGFYALEGGTWRWSKQTFGVILRAPQPAAKLLLHFALPGLVLERLGPITITATVNGSELAAETFTNEGEQVYSRDVELKDLAKVEFRTDKTLAAGVIDERELALIVSRVELIPR